MITKKCSKCSISKPCLEFHKDKEVKEREITKPYNLIKEDLERYFAIDISSGLFSGRSALIKDILRWQIFHNFLMVIPSLIYLFLYGFFAINYLPIVTQYSEGIRVAITIAGLIGGAISIITFPFGFLVPLFLGCQALVSPDLYLINYLHNLQEKEDVNS